MTEWWAWLLIGLVIGGTLGAGTMALMNYTK
jgi:hypothetical protein